MKKGSAATVPEDRNIYTHRNQESQVKQCCLPNRAPARTVCSPDFFLCLSSGYNLNICSYTDSHQFYTRTSHSHWSLIFFDASRLDTAVVSTHIQTHTNPTHAHHTHTTRIQTNLQLHSKHSASFVRSPGPSMVHRRRARRIPFVVLRMRGDIIYWGRTPVRDASAIPRN
jgi:hypothetical protein